MPKCIVHGAYGRYSPGEQHNHDAAEHALILGTASSASSSGGLKTRAVVVDLYTGAVVSDVVLPFAAAHMLPLPGGAGGDDHHEPSAMLLVDAGGSVAHVFPATEVRGGLYGLGAVGYVRDKAVEVRSGVGVGGWGLKGLGARV